VTPYNATPSQAAASQAGIAWQINPSVLGFGPAYGGLGFRNNGTLAIIGSGSVAARPRRRQ
jgi:hypothetical protein